MAKFTATVIETVTIEKMYVIEADSIEEAREMAERGETEVEAEIRVQGVLDREIVEIGTSASAAA